MKIQKEESNMNEEKKLESELEALGKELDQSETVDKEETAELNDEPAGVEAAADATEQHEAGVEKFLEKMIHKK